MGCARDLSARVMVCVFGSAVVVGCGNLETKSGSVDDVEEGSDSSPDPAAPDPEETPETEEGEGEQGFVPTGDVPSVESCDAMDADSCGIRRKCTFDFGQHGACPQSVCAPILGHVQPGEPCRVFDGPGEDDCEKGSYCLFVDHETGIGRCMAMCQGSYPSPECPVGSSCISWNSGLSYCEWDCHPLAQDCPGGYGCYPSYFGEFSCQGFFEPVVGEGEACHYDNSCSTGSLCVAAEHLSGCLDDACCTLFCSVSGDGSECTAPDETCVPYFEDPAPPGLDDVGLCALPD